MIDYSAKENLKKNWGEKANALDCYVEVKLIDPISPWYCYIYAMDEDEDTVQCLLYTFGICTLSLKDILSMYNSHGEHPKIDTEYRKIKISELLKRLKYEC